MVPINKDVTQRNDRAVKLSTVVPLANDLTANPFFTSKSIGGPHIYPSTHQWDHTMTTTTYHSSLPLYDRRRRRQPRRQQQLDDTVSPPPYVWGGGGGTRIRRNSSYADSRSTSYQDLPSSQGIRSSSATSFRYSHSTPVELGAEKMDHQQPQVKYTNKSSSWGKEEGPLFHHHHGHYQNRPYDLNDPTIYYFSNSSIPPPLDHPPPSLPEDFFIPRVKHLQGDDHPDYSHKQKVSQARIMSWMSIGLCVSIGTICCILGGTWNSLTLLALGLELYIDMFSSLAVLWRFRTLDVDALVHLSLLGPHPILPGHGTRSLHPRWMVGSGTTSPVVTPVEWGRGTVSPDALHANSPTFIKNQMDSPVKSEIWQRTTTSRAASNTTTVVALDQTISPLVRSPSAQDDITKNVKYNVNVSSECDAGYNCDNYSDILSTADQDSSDPSSTTFAAVISDEYISPTNSADDYDFLQMSSLDRRRLWAIRKNQQEEDKERYTSLFVGVLLAILGLYVLADALIVLSKPQESHSFEIHSQVAVVVCIVSWSSAVIFGGLVVWKWRLAKDLHSQVLKKDAVCSGFGVLLSVFSGIAGVVEISSTGAISSQSIDSIAALGLAVIMLIEGARTVVFNTAEYCKSI